MSPQINWDELKPIKPVIHCDRRTATELGEAMQLREAEKRLTNPTITFADIVGWFILFTTSVGLLGWIAIQIARWAGVW